jgi:Tfp pilus assembly protein PilO
MNKYIKNNKIVLAIFLYAVFLGALYFFIIRYFFNEIENKVNKIQEKIVIQENLKEKNSKLPAFRDQFELIQKGESKMAINLNKDSVVELIKKIEKISEETGNKVKIEVSENDSLAKKNSAKSGKEEENKKKSIAEKLPLEKSMTINIQLMGNYGNLIDFIRKIENMNYYCDILSLNISKGDGNFSNSSKNPFDSGNLGSGDIIDKDKGIFSQLAVVFYLDK